MITAKKRQIGSLITHLGKDDNHLWNALTSLQDQSNQVVGNIQDLVKAIIDAGISIAGAPATLALYAQASADFPLPLTATNVPGMTLTLDRPGKWFLIATLGVTEGSAGNKDEGQMAICYLTIDGANVGVPALFIFPTVAGNATSGASITTQFIYDSSAPSNFTIQAYKNGGTGDSYLSVYSAMSASWIGA